MWAKIASIIITPILGWLERVLRDLFVRAEENRDLAKKHTERLAQAEKVEALRIEFLNAQSEGKDTTEIKERLRAESKILIHMYSNS